MYPATVDVRARTRRFFNRLGRKKCPHVDTVMKQTCEGGDTCPAQDTAAEEVRHALHWTRHTGHVAGAGAARVRGHGLEQLVPLQPELRQRPPRQDQALQVAGDN